jgi:CheY-like chemotaxis protein
MASMVAGRVLFVDDEEGVRDVAREFLQDSGFEVELACSAEEALASFAAGAFDAVVTDYKMPGATGAELARELRRLRPGLPIVLLTGFLSALDRRPLAELFDDILEKPLGVAELGRAVAARLSHPQDPAP